MENVFIRGDPEESVPRRNVPGLQLMKSLLLNTNYLIYLRRLPSLYLISFLSVALHEVLHSCVIDFVEYGYYNIRTFDSVRCGSRVK